MECVTDNPMTVDKSQMLDLKPEREPETTKFTPQVPQIVPQQVQHPPTENVPATPSAGKFGWTSVVDTLNSLPFVTRDSECFIAKKICQSEVLKLSYLHPNAITDSEEYFRVYRMTSSEAITYNEVNIMHCDKGLVGNYSFKAGDILFNLEDIKAYVQFLLAYKNAVKYKKMQNDIFGFVKINNINTTVPFVWSEGKQLMPTFYFDGADELLKDKCICITDKWMCLYFRVCFILQKVRPELYNPKSLQVIDVMDIKPLFPPYAIFTLSWPEDGYKYQNFVAIIERNDRSPEAMLAAMHGVSITEPPQSPLINQNLNENRPDLIPAAAVMHGMTEPQQSPLINQENRPDLISRTPAASQQSNMYNPFNFFAKPQQSSATYQKPINDTCSSPFCKECSFNNIPLAKTYYPSPASPVSTTTNQIPAENSSPRKNKQLNRYRARRNNKDSNNIQFIMPRDLLPTEVPHQMPTSSSTNRLSNVPYASPQSASSPELQFPSPIISGASIGSMSGDSQTNGRARSDPRSDPWSPTYNYEPMRRDPRTSCSFTNEPYKRDLQNQRRSKLAAFYNYYQLSLQQQENINIHNNNNDNRVFSSNTPLPQSVIVTSAGYCSASEYNNGTVASASMHLPQNVIVSSAGYYSGGYNNGAVSSSNTHLPQNIFVTSRSYNNVLENAQSVIVNSEGYYMPVNDPVYLPGSVTSSRTTNASSGIETLL